MALGLAVAPRKPEGRPHRWQVTAQTCRKASHLGRAAIGQAFEPSVELPDPPPVHESEKFPGEAPNFGHHGFDLAERLCESLVVGVFRFIDGKLAPPHQPAKRAPCRGARHRPHRSLNQRRLALRGEQTHNAGVHRSAIAGIASLSDLQPDLSRVAAALCEAILDEAAVGI